MKLNQGMKQENIEAFLRTLGKEPNQNYVYGVVPPGVLSILMLGNFVGATMEYNIIAFYPDELVLLPLKMSGNFNGEHYVLPRNEMEDFQVKKGMLNYTVKFRTPEGKIKFNLNKIAAGAKWQRDNLEYLAANNWYH